MDAGEGKRGDTDEALGAVAGSPSIEPETARRSAALEEELAALEAMLPGKTKPSPRSDPNDDASSPPP